MIRVRVRAGERRELQKGLGAELQAQCRRGIAVGTPQPRKHATAVRVVGACGLPLIVCIGVGDSAEERAECEAEVCHVGWPCGNASGVGDAKDARSHGELGRRAVPNLDARDDTGHAVGAEPLGLALEEAANGGHAARVNPVAFQERTQPADQEHAVRRVVGVVDVSMALQRTKVDEAAAGAPGAYPEAPGAADHVDGAAVCLSS
mmetsp:Transcript_24628/g.77193  ORF Transcript_24628/g.77193 Transcript_24628/m.77193 type:complete len:205 (-) Transcript_24628:284-898(-)